eukprot:5844705-Amphidinium_carterae.1
MELAFQCKSYVESTCVRPKSHNLAFNSKSRTMFKLFRSLTFAVLSLQPPMCTTRAHTTHKKNRTHCNVVCLHTAASRDSTRTRATKDNKVACRFEAKTTFSNSKGKHHHVHMCWYS